MKLFSAVVLLLISSVSHAQCPAWKPDLQFTIEGADEVQTLAWLSGWTFSLAKISEEEHLDVHIPSCDYLISQEIISILNAKFSGEVVSAETAADAIWPDLKYRLDQIFASPAAP
jgi:hypothetical protein